MRGRRWNGAWSTGWFRLRISWKRRREELARQIAEKPPATVAAGKRAFYQQMDLGVAKAYDLASQVIAASFAHEEGRSGMDAFIDKRPPPKNP